jgi:hypothetical protein
MLILLDSIYTNLFDLIFALTREDTPAVRHNDIDQGKFHPHELQPTKNYFFGLYLILWDFARKISLITHSRLNGIYRYLLAFPQQREGLFSSSTKKWWWRLLAMSISLITLGERTKIFFLGTSNEISVSYIGKSSSGRISLFSFITTPPAKEVA